jgi:glycosyltransferase involved in cell wall biosynthesis
LRQDYDNLEVVITDNCSTDDTLKVLERYKDDPRVRVSQNPVNIGITPNINVGIGLTRGEYVVILSADDWLLPGHISRLVAVAEQNPEVGLVYSTAYLCKPDGAPFSVRHLIGQTLVDYAGARDELGWLLASCVMCLPTILFRRAVFDRHGMLDESFEVASDWEICVRMVLGGEKTAYIPVPLVGVRIHESQASSVGGYIASGKDIREHLDIIERYYDSSAFERTHGREVRMLSAVNYHREMLKQLSPEKWTDELQVRTDRVLFRLTRDQRRRGTRKPPKVSVIVTSTARTASLGACLQSLAAQTYPHWEVWVLQDHGFDVRGYAALQVPAEKFHYGRAIDRLGPAGLRTQGMYVASGDYMLFLDEDTQILPDHLERLVAAAEQGDGVAIAGSVVQFNETEGIGWHPVGNSDGVYLLKPAPNDLLIANCLPISAVLFDTAAADVLDSVDVGYGMCADWEFLIRLSRLRQLAYTGTRTLVEHAFLELKMQTLSNMWGSYLDRMQAVYNKYEPGTPDVQQGRDRHRSSVNAVMRAGPGGYKDVQNLFRLYSVLAGSGASEAARISA